MCRRPPGGIMCVGIAPARERRVGKGEEEAPVSDEEKNKALTRWWWEEVWVKGNLAAMDEFMAPNYVDHPNLPGLPPGPEGMKQALTYYHSASPELQATLEDIFAADDRVALALECSRHPPGRVVRRSPDRAPLYDGRDHHLPDRRGQGGGRLEQHRGEPYGGRTAVVDRRRWMAKEERRHPRHRARSVSPVLGRPNPQPQLALPGCGGPGARTHRARAASR